METLDKPNINWDGDAQGLNEDSLRSGPEFSVLALTPGILDQNDGRKNSRLLRPLYDYWLNLNPNRNPAFKVQLPLPV